MNLDEPAEHRRVVATVTEGLPRATCSRWRRTKEVRHGSLGFGDRRRWWHW